MSRSKTLKELEIQSGAQGLLHQLVTDLIRFEARLDMRSSTQEIVEAFMGLGIEPQDQAGAFLLPRKLADGLSAEHDSAYGRAAIELLDAYDARRRVRSGLKAKLGALQRKAERYQLEAREEARVQYLGLLLEHNFKP
jgi:hypothetical protein